MLEWRRDTILTGALENTAIDAGWRRPVDQVAMAMGVIAELESRNVAYNSANPEFASTAADFEYVCAELILGEGDVLEGREFFYAFPQSGLLVDLEPTPLGASISNLLDRDISLVTLPDRTKLSNEAYPELEGKESDLRRPSTVGRAALKLSANRVMQPDVFFRAAYDLDFEDARDQAVMGFGAMVHMLAAGIIEAGVLRGATFVPDGRGVGSIFRDLGEWWFLQAPRMHFDTRGASEKPTPPPAPKGTVFNIVTNQW